MQDNEGLSHLLLPQAGGTTGPEKSRDMGNGVVLFRDPYGSFRFVMVVSGIPVAAMQVIQRSRGHGHISNVYTAPQFRRLGYGKLLYDTAKRVFTKQLTFSTDLSDSGKAFQKGVMENTYSMMGNFSEWLKSDTLTSLRSLLNEDSDRYSVEVNYRTEMEELLTAYAKLVLGYVMAGMKNAGYHVRHIYSEKPFRIVVAARNWEDGEWTATVLYNPHINRFVIGTGFWNKDRKTISVQHHETLNATSASEIVKKVINTMMNLKRQEPRKVSDLKPAQMKRGPRR